MKKILTILLFTTSIIASYERGQLDTVKPNDSLAYNKLMGGLADNKQMVFNDYIDANPPKLGGR